MIIREFAPIEPNQDPSGKLAEMVVNTQYEDVSSDVIAVTKKIILENICLYHRWIKMGSRSSNC